MFLSYLFYFGFTVNQITFMLSYCFLNFFNLLLFLIENLFSSLNLFVHFYRFFIDFLHFILSFQYVAARDCNLNLILFDLFVKLNRFGIQIFCGFFQRSQFLTFLVKICLQHDKFYLCFFVDSGNFLLFQKYVPQLDFILQNCLSLLSQDCFILFLLNSDPFL